MTLGLNSGVEDCWLCEPQRLQSGQCPPGRVSCSFWGPGCLLPCSSGSGTDTPFSQGQVPGCWIFEAFPFGLVWCPACHPGFLKKPPPSLRSGWFMMRWSWVVYASPFWRLWKRKQARSSGTCLLGAHQLPLLQSRLWVHGSLWGDPTTSQC